ncbi:calcium/sodium antiporter [Labilibaculum sp.]|uniref:calcium/sodium antiporter n=1 Tax=Labilibaculum sp. TaxID=2060723 RepID=UPI00356387D3
MLVPIILIGVGFVLLIKGADWMVSGSSAFAKKNNISNIAIGLTIVAFGTSAPELVVNSFASFHGYSDIVFGNVIGSNNFNLFIILGIVGLISPIIVQSNTVWKEIPLSLFAVLILYLLSNSFFFQESSILTRFDGLVLLVMFGFFLFYVYRQLKTEDTVSEIAIIPMSTLKIWSLIILGLLGLILGGKFVVDNAVEVASRMGVSEKIIGLTIVAAGTSLPELVTSVVAVLRKNNDIAIGNIIGSNIFNILLIISVSSFVKPIEFNSLFNIDIYILAGGTIFLFIAMFTGRKKKLDRWEAALLLGSYLAYSVYLVGKEL